MLTKFRAIEDAPKDQGEILARDIAGATWLVLWEEDCWVTITPEGSWELDGLVDYILLKDLLEQLEVTT